MRKTCFALCLLSALAGCADKQAEADKASTLPEARKGFQTKLVNRGGARQPAPEPPAQVFRKVTYDAAPGKLAAYLTPDPGFGQKLPAIIWITGGDCNSIGDVWNEGPPKNDQSASAFRKEDIVMMFPSLRGGNDNPGSKEGFLGEVDDVLSAAEFLSKQPHVDPSRIYLGGHSTGGTLVMLVAECSDRFRAVFSFGPVDDVNSYPAEFLHFDTSNRREGQLRSPGRWLHSVKSPTFVFEGTRDGNIDALNNMARASQNAKVKFIAAKGADHFSVLAPTNSLIVQKIHRDTGPATNLTFSEAEVSAAFGR